MALMVSTLDIMGATPYERYCAHFTAYSESDFFNDRRQLMMDGIHYTRGLFQQSDRWWPNPTDIPTATRSFLNDFRKKGATHINVPVEDIWYTQMWAAPEPARFRVAFYASLETINYTDRIPRMPAIMADKLYFTHNGKP